MRVSIIIPTCNGMPLLRRVLDGILDQQCSVPYDLYCIDSESTDGTWQELGRRGVRRERIRRSEFNHGATRNRAFGETTGELLVSTVQDATPANRGWLQGLVDALLSAPEVAGAYSRQLPYDTANPFVRLRIQNWAAGRAVRVVQHLPKGRSLAELAPLEQLSLCAFDDVSSIMRRSVWERQPLPERRFGEDLAWGQKIIAAGGTIVYEPASTVLHSHDTGALEEFRRIYMDHANLHELFGVTTVRTLRDAWRGSRSQTRLYRELVDKLSPPEDQREELMRRGRRLAFAETFAQWLGARSLRKRPPAGVFAMIEAYVHR